MKHVAKKRFGQNFLTDQSIVTSLIDAINPKTEEVIIEIGPGLGALTKPLLKKINHLHVVEIDRDIVSWMQNEYAKPIYINNAITIHNVDALKFDFTSLSENLRVVGNLPYNISTPILFHLLENVSHIIDMHFMLQKEVVERMVASPSNPAYGRLSVMLQYHLQMEYLKIPTGECYHFPPMGNLQYIP
jgi:16S rRNA (adenine1518-N6/adenine1519-N6)-dimethyltransferase